MSKDDLVAKRELFKCLDEIAQEETSVLRKAIERFAVERCGKNDRIRSDPSRLMLLNRYVLDVPAHATHEDARFSGGWFGRPVNDDEVDLLWPFAADEDGRLDVVGEFHGYNGPPYNGVAEFDYFNERFGRRNQK